VDRVDRADPRDLLAGVDPGLARLRLASVAVLSMMLAAGATELVRGFLAPGEPVTVLLVSGAVAMISNLAVNEPDLRRRRITTALALGPALAATSLGTLLTPYRIVADAVFVAVMIAAVWVRRYGPRGFALGQAAFITFLFTQFLRVQPTQLPWLLVAVTIGIGSTLLLRGVVFAERPERTLRRLVAAFRGRAHALLGAVDDVLAHLDPDRHRDRELDRPADHMARARRRLNETAILVEDQLEQTTAGRVWPGLENDLLALRIFDAELALERLAVAAGRLTRPDGDTLDGIPRTALRIGIGRSGQPWPAGPGPTGCWRAPRTPAVPSPASAPTPPPVTSARSALRSPCGGWPTRWSTRSATRRSAATVETQRPRRPRAASTTTTRTGPRHAPTPPATPPQAGSRATGLPVSPSPAGRPCRSASRRAWPSWPVSCSLPPGGTGQ